MKAFMILLNQLLCYVSHNFRVLSNKFDIVYVNKLNKKCSAITHVVGNHTYINRHERLSNITLRHKLKYMNFVVMAIHQHFTVAVIVFDNEHNSIPQINLKRPIASS
jgi:hypothetical protein